MSYSLLEAYRDLQKLTEEVNENLFANYVSDLWIFIDVLQNKRILTNFNQQNARDFDFRGNHICLTNDLINPPAIMPQLNFGIVIDKNELINYINNNPDKFRKVPPFALENLQDSKSIDKDKLVSLDIHDDSRYRRWVEKNLSQGMFIQGLSYYSGSYYIKFKQWTWREIPKDNNGSYSNKLIDFCNKVRDIFTEEYQQQKLKESNNNINPEIILNLILREKESDIDVENADEMKEQLKLTEAPITINPGDTESKEKAIKLINCICILLNEFYTVNFSDFIKHFNINLKGSKRKNKTINTVTSNKVDEIKFIEENFEDIVSGSSTNKYNAFAQIAYYFKCGDVGGGRAGRLFKLTSKDIKEKSNDYYYFKKDSTLDLKNDDFIFVVSPDGTSGTNSYLQIQANMVNENCCIALRTNLEDKLEVTNCEVKEYSISDKLTDEESNIIDKLILNEHEYRLYVPEVDTEKQTKNDYENIENAYFTFNDNEHIVKELKLPKIYQQYNVNNPLQTVPVYKFKLYEWLTTNTPNYDYKFSTYNLKQYILVNNSNKKESEEKINSAVSSLRNDLIDFYKQLQTYKSNGVKLNFYTVNVGNFKSLSTMYLDGEKKDYSYAIDTKELNKVKEYNLDSISSQSYKTINSWIDTSGNSLWDGQKFKQTFITDKGVRTEWFVKVKTGHKETNENQNIARIQSAVLVYYCDEEYETCNINDRDKHIYILMYNETGHLDIPHTGIEADKNQKLDQAGMEAVKADTGLELTDLHDTGNAYLYYENASKFWNTVKNKKDILKWYYYYNKLLYKKVDYTTLRPLKGEAKWINLYDLFTGHIGTFCHIKQTIYRLMLKLREVNNKLGASAKKINKRKINVRPKKVNNSWTWTASTFRDDGSKQSWSYSNENRDYCYKALQLAYDSDWNYNVWRYLLKQAGLPIKSTDDDIVVNIREVTMPSGKKKFRWTRIIYNASDAQKNSSQKVSNSSSNGTTSWTYEDENREKCEQALALAKSINWRDFNEWQNLLKKYQLDHTGEAINNDKTNLRKRLKKNGDISYYFWVKNIRNPSKEQINSSRNIQYDKGVPYTSWYYPNEDDKIAQKALDLAKAINWRDYNEWLNLLRNAHLPLPPESTSENKTTNNEQED